MRGWSYCLLVLTALPLCSCDDQDPLYSAVADLEVRPAELDLGAVALHEGPKTGMLVLRNSGSTPIHLLRAQLKTESDELTILSAAETIEPGKVGHLVVRYEPKAEGIDQGIIQLETDDLSRIHEAKVVARGVSVRLGISGDVLACGDQAGVNFGRVPVGETARRTVRLSSLGLSPVEISSTRVLGSTDFQLASALAETRLDAGSSIEIEVLYRPSHSGAAAGDWVLTTNEPGTTSPSIRLCGEGSAAAICVSPPSLDLGPVAPGASQIGVLRVESCGELPLELGGAELVADGSAPLGDGFGLASSLPTSLAPGVFSELAIKFSSSVPGVQRAAVVVRSSAAGMPRLVVPLTARVPGPCSWSVLPPRLPFNAHELPEVRQVLISNDGTTECHVTRLELTSGAPGFAFDGTVDLPWVLPPGGSRVVGLVFDPRIATQGTGQLLAQTEVQQAKVVDLFGPAPELSGCRLDPRPRFIDLGVLKVLERSSAGVELVNVGRGSCSLSSVALAAGSSPSLMLPAVALGLLGPGQHRVIPVDVRPTVTGPIRGQLVITSDDVDEPVRSLPIFGLAAEMQLCVEPNVLAFGMVSGESEERVRLVACGTQPVELLGVHWKVPDGELSLVGLPSLPRVLQPGEIQEARVVYRPVDEDDDRATLVIASSDPSRPAVEVKVTGGRLGLPISAGQFLYFWQVTGSEGDIRRLPLQRAAPAETFFGSGTGHGCGGCHSLSPDGRYVALFTQAGMRILETATQRDVTPISGTPRTYGFVSWNPDPTAGAGHELVVGDGRLRRLSVVAGDLGTIPGTDIPGLLANMPSWGPSGEIAFVRGPIGWEAGFSGTTDVLIISPAGGAPRLLRGASANGRANYYPGYSPNGRWLVITTSEQAVTTVSALDARITLVAADNTGRSDPLVAANGGSSSYARWSRDGRYLSFASNRPGGAGSWDLYVAAIDPTTGVAQRAVNLREVNGPDAEHLADWSP